MTREHDFIFESVVVGHEFFFARHQIQNQRLYFLKWTVITIKFIRKIGQLFFKVMFMVFMITNSLVEIGKVHRKERWDMKTILQLLRIKSIFWPRSFFGGLFFLFSLF
jgi:hypothetical protein